MPVVVSNLLGAVATFAISGLSKHNIIILLGVRRELYVPFDVK